jgi:hypothetical protein
VFFLNCVCVQPHASIDSMRADASPIVCFCMLDVLISNREREGVAAG